MREFRPAPEWFERAVATPFASHDVVVEGCRIRYQTWGEEVAPLPGILLVHGHGAHAHWWDFIAPFLADHYRVAALDLSGNGDSDHRDRYSLALYAEEILTVATAAGLGDQVILAGHSFGGTLCRVAAALRPERVRALLLLDSALVARRAGRNATQRPVAQNPPRQRPERIYPSREVAARRFRLRPPQPCANTFILAHLAAHSVGEVPGGWGWKGDLRLFAKMHADPHLQLPDAATMVREWPFPIGLIHGELSRFFPPPVVSALTQVLGERHILGVADAHHHLFLDQPLAFVAAVRSLLARWGLP